MRPTRYDGTTFLTNETATKEPPKAVAKKLLPSALRSVVVNLRGPKTRHDTLEGRDHLVVPMVMLTAGVHSGSHGPILYTNEELAKVPEVWNSKPIVVYHPTINGQGVSACDPLIFNSRKIGVIFNTRFDGRLIAEAWLDVEKMKAVDDRILTKIENGEMVEVSTGLWTENEESVGEWNGETYTAIAKNFKPDHLAILPDLKGACSIEDGAGLLRNEASYDQTRELLQKALCESMGSSDSYSCWVADVFDAFFVYAQDRQMFKQSYTTTDIKATLVGEPMEVVRVIQYRTASDGAVLNHDKETNVKDQLIKELITNSKGLWTEADREFLNKQDEKRLQGFVAAIKNEQKPVEAPKPEIKPEVKPAEVKNVKTLQEYVNEAPIEFRDVIVNGINELTKAKAAEVQKILSNKRNTFTMEALQSKSLEELKAIATLAVEPSAPKAPALYSGLGDVGLMGNRQAETEEPLDLPSTLVEKK